MTATRLAALALAAATILAATGCGGAANSTHGGSSASTPSGPAAPGAGASGASTPRPLTRSELIARADPICAHAAQELYGATSVTKPSAVPAAAAAAATYARRVSAKLARLTPPASMAGDWKVIVTSYQTLAKALSRESESAKRHPGKLDQPVYAEYERSGQEKTTAAKRHGFKACAKF